jgi:hypothetical protein
MPEKMILLVEAFRMGLRAKHPQRPGLADEIQDHRHFWWNEKGAGPSEKQAADDAREALLDAIASQSIRLHGRLPNALPDDINPTEVVRQGINIFDNTLEVYEPSTRSSPFRILRTYRNVHCYEDEIRNLATTPSLGGSGPPLSKGEAAEKAADYLPVGDAPASHQVAPFMRPSGVQTNKQAQMKSEAIAWIRSRPVVPSLKKDEVLVAMMGAIKGLSERQAKAAWDDGAPAEWKKPGPK